MPELAWPIGYPMALSLMLLVAIIMLSYFWTLKFLIVAGNLGLLFVIIDVAAGTPFIRPV